MSKDQPTPMTDAMIADHGGMANWQWHDFARQLERELAVITKSHELAWRNAALRPSLAAPTAETVQLAISALREAEAILGGEYGDTYAVLCETMFKLERALESAPLSPLAAPRSTYRCGTCGVECLAAETAGAPVSYSAPPERPEDQDFSIFAEANAMTEAAVSARATPACPAESASLKEKL